MLFAPGKWDEIIPFSLSILVLFDIFRKQGYFYCSLKNGKKKKPTMLNISIFEQLRQVTRETDGGGGQRQMHCFSLLRRTAAFTGQPRPCLCFDW